MIDTLQPLKIERVTLKERHPIYTIQACSDELNMQKAKRAKYIFLSREDYAAMCLELRRSWYPSPSNDIYVCQIFGVFVAPLDELPHSEEYAHARMTFEYLEYRAPQLQKGEALILY